MLRCMVCPESMKMSCSVGVLRVVVLGEGLKGSLKCWWWTSGAN